LLTSPTTHHLRPDSPTATAITDALDELVVYDHSDEDDAACVLLALIAVDLDELAA
jgi:hypothetical protein